MTVEECNEYLRRIGYSGPLEPEFATLAALQRAHLFRIPFENLDIHLGCEIVLDEARFFEKVVRRRRGGFCYELNGLFAALLRNLGFAVSLLSAGVAHESGGFGPEYDHLALLVDGRWIADVGFGEFYLDPLPLAAIPADGGFHVVSRGGQPQYRFTTEPRTLEEFAERCRFHQTSPESSFTRRRVCTLARPEGRITLSENRLIVTDGENRRERTLSGEDEIRRVLWEEFGIL